MHGSIGIDTQRRHPIRIMTTNVVVGMIYLFDDWHKAATKHQVKVTVGSTLALFGLFCLPLIKKAIVFSVGIFGYSNSQAAINCSCTIY